MVASPLMMLVVMRGMHGQDTHGGHDQHRDDRHEDLLHKHDHPAGAGQP
ncbi:hypothetical protein [Streptomyces sp. NPDC002573]